MRDTCLYASSVPQLQGHWQWECGLAAAESNYLLRRALCRGSGLYGTPMVELLQLGGLMSQAENNGSRGLVVDWDRERRIYQVKLDDGRIVPVKSEHVRWPPPSG